MNNLAIGTQCRISPIGDEYDAVRVIITRIIEAGYYEITFVEPVTYTSSAADIYTPRRLMHKIGDNGEFVDNDLAAISALELLADVAE